MGIVLCKVIGMSLENLLTLFVLSTLALTATSQVLNPQGGVAADRNEHKYLVWIRVKYNNAEGRVDHSEYGGGIIINERWILTAAHNFEDTTDDGQFTGRKPDVVEIVAGTKDLEVFDDDVQEISTDMSAVIMHQEYIESKSDRHDIALVLLKHQHLNYSHVVEAANLIKSNAPKFPAGTPVTIVGWGKRGIFENKNIAHKGTVKIIPDSHCNNDVIGEDFKSGYHICYGCTEGRCPMGTQGDSGGPVVTADGVVVATHNGGCSESVENYYTRRMTWRCPGFGIDIRVFRGWIDEKMAEQYPFFWRLLRSLKNNFLSAANYITFGLLN